VIVTKDMIKAMRKGSVIVDMAAEQGGNVEGSVAGQTVEIEGVTIIGDGNWTNVVAKDASTMYSANLYNLLAHFWNKETKTFNLNPEDEILRSCVVTHQGEIVSELVKNLIK
jgi:NAD(P) transhydrogenase subunit alpha